MSDEIGSGAKVQMPRGAVSCCSKRSEAQCASWGEA
jgi:hypothetical protein